MRLCRVFIAHAFSLMYSFSSFLSSSVEKKTVWKVFRSDHFSFSFFRGCQIQLQLRRSHRCRKTQLLMTPLWIESCSARMASSPSFCENRFWRTEPFIEDLFLKSYDENRIGYGTVVWRLAFQSSRPGSKPTKVQMVQSLLACVWTNLLWFMIVRSFTPRSLFCVIHRQHLGNIRIKRYFSN